MRGNILYLQAEDYEATKLILFLSSSCLIQCSSSKLLKSIFNRNTIFLHYLQFDQISRIAIYFADPTIIIPMINILRHRKDTYSKISLSSFSP